MKKVLVKLTIVAALVSGVFVATATTTQEQAIGGITTYGHGDPGGGIRP